MTPGGAPLATWWHDSNHDGVSEWRCHIPARHLPGVRVAVGVFDPALQQGDAAVFFSAVASREELDGMVEAKRLGIRVLLDVEDNQVCDLELMPWWRAKVAANAGMTFSSLAFPPVASREEVYAPFHESLALHREALAIADALIVPTEETARAYAGLHDEIHVVPNAVDPSSWPRLEKPDDDVFRIGVFASDTHAVDLSLVAGALRWASEQPAVEILVGGVNPRLYTWAEKRREQELLRREKLVEKDENGQWVNAPLLFLRRFEERQASWSFPFQQLPLVSYPEYRRLLMRLDVGLCPLIETPWSRCRSDSKPLEYAMAGALPVCSDSEPYRGWRWPLVADSQGFVDRLAWCLENRATVREHGLAWREAVIAERSIDRTLDGWRAAVSGSDRVRHVTWRTSSVVRL